MKLWRIFKGGRIFWKQIKRKRCWVQLGSLASSVAQQQGEKGAPARAQNRAGPFGRVLRSREGTKEQGTLPARCSTQSKASDAPYSAFPSAAAGEAGGVGLCSGVQAVAAWPRQPRVTWRR